MPSSMTVDLKLNVLQGTISHYSIVTIVFFASYIVFQPPATVICRYLGPRNFLSAIVILWGGVMIGMGFADSYGTMAALRVVLGVLEAGFFPSCVYLLSTWCTYFVVVENCWHNTNHPYRHSFRYRKAVLVLLYSWKSGFRLRRYSGLRIDATQGTSGAQRMAL